MKDSNNNSKLEELKIKQQVERIVSQNKLNHEALIQATKDNMKNPNKSIEARQKEIVKNKLREQDKRNKRELDETKLVMDVEKNLGKWADIEARLKDLNAEELQRKQARQKDVQKYMNEINAKKVSNSYAIEKLEKAEREKYRQAYKKEQAKKDALVPQLNRVLETEKEKRINSKINRAKAEIVKQNTVTYKTTTSAPKPVPVESKPKKNFFLNLVSKIFKKQKPAEKVDGNVVLKNSPVKNTPTKTTVLNNSRTSSKREITGYMIPGVRVYEENIDNYHGRNMKHFIDVSIGVAQKGVSQKRDSFINTLQYKIDEQRAKDNLKNATKPTYKPRTL